MVESIENEVVVNAEPEHSHGMAESNVGNDVIMVESEVRPNGDEMLVDDAKDKTVDQNMKAEATEKDLCLSEKSLADGEEKDGKSNLDKITEVSNKEFSEFNNMSGLVHDQEAMGIKTEATGCKDVFPVATGDVEPISAEEENANLEIVKNDTLKGNISHVEHETVAGRSRETVGSNGETQAGTDLPPIHEGSVMLAPAQNICSTVASAVIHHEPTVDSASVNNDDVHLVSSSAGNLVVLDSGQHQILGNATIASSVSQQTEEFEEQMQSNLGKVQENTNGFTFPDNDFFAPVSCQNVDQSVEASERIDSSIGQVVEIQDHCNDTEMIDSGEVNEEPQELFSEISVSQSEDDDEQFGSHLREKANHPENEGTDIHLQEEDSVTNNVSLLRNKDVDEEPLTGAEMSLHREEENAKCVASRVGPLAKECRATYELSPETADQFPVNDLVWGKVKSHPWWPGQIFDPSDSSEKAMKHHRKDCYLVAYFGDKTFAWNEASQLKPFRTHFSQEEKQSSSEAFQNAIDCALEEVSRRVELGLACSCMPEETYDRIKFQIVENAGIQTDSSKREGGDDHTSSESFQPDKLVDYVRNLAQLPTCGANQLELTVAKAQLLSFYRLKGRQSLPEVQYFEGLLEIDIDTSLSQVSSLPTESEPADSVAADDVSCTVRSKGPKRKHNLKDIVYRRRKEKSFSEIMGESLFYYDEDDDLDEKLNGMLNSPTPGKKRKASNFLDDEPMVPESSRTISLAKVLQTATPSSRQSFKIGDCIRRVASQLTGSSSTVKSTDDGNNEQAGDDIDKSLDIPEDRHNENMVISIEETSPDDFLWELYLTAQDPMRAHGFSKSVVSYFSEFRDAAVSTQRKINGKSSTARGRSGRKRKSSLSLSVSPEAFEFDDRKDSYWADMVVENNSEAKQPERRSRKRKDHQLGTGDPDWADAVVENNSEAKQPARRSRKRKDQLGAGDPEKPNKSTQRRNSKKQNVNGNHHELTVEQSSADEVKQELPTELILTFGDNSVPSVADLNRMFRRFGPLKESETEVDRQNSRARLVYKTGSDAEIAYSSAATFNIFGPITVNYQLGQTPPVSSHSLVPALVHCTEDAA